MKLTHTLIALMAVVAALTGCTNDNEDPAQKDLTASFDADFAALLAERGIIPNAARITISQVNRIQEIDVSGTYDNPGKLTSLAGIEYFKALTSLECRYNQITGLDLRNHPKLRRLSCYNNQLSELDLSQNTALGSLYCSSNQLTELDVNNNTALVVLQCDHNQITQLDVSKNTALVQFECGSNKLDVLEVSNNTALKQILCESNQLDVLDVSKNIALVTFWCEDNHLSELDVSKNTALNDFRCSLNPGDGSKFVVNAWFDDNSIPPRNLQRAGWEYQGNTITPQYREVVQ